PSWGHAICEGEEAGRDGEIERLGSPQVDDEFELGHLENRQIGRLFTFEDTAGINSDVAIAVFNVVPIAHQAAGGGKIPPAIDRRHPEASGKQRKLLRTAEKQRI